MLFAPQAQSKHSDQYVPFRFRKVDSHIVITNDFGDAEFLTEDEFEQFVSGTYLFNEELKKRLSDANFLANNFNLETQVNRYWKKRAFLDHGPSLFAFVLTERCNHGCQYCHSSVVGMERTDTDMTVEMAERCVNTVLAAPGYALTIEFQGGEPTANWDVLCHIVRYAKQRNVFARKSLAFSLVTNFSMMSDERLDFLIDNRVQICTSLDGPEELHNRTRIFGQGNSHALTVHWINRVNQRYREMGLDSNLYRVEALPTITRFSLPLWKEIVDEFVRQGCRAVFLRKLDPFGFAATTRRKLGYSVDEFLEFYRAAFDYILQLNVEGIQVLERNAAIMLCKIIGDSEPNYLDLRSPGGAAIGQLAFHPNGNVYSSDEGRMVAAMGDDTFLLGNVLNDSYLDIMTRPAVKALVLAGTNDAQPDCVQCVYKPYCGQQPEYNYKTQGSIFGRMRDSEWCRKHKGIFDHVMQRLRLATPEERDVFRKWTTSRPQEHFIHMVPVP